MKKLYVGCRVRIVGARLSLHLIGTEARIQRWSDDAYCGATRQWYSGWILDATSISGGPFCALPDQLEPIQDPGHQVISWEEMADLWTPEKVGV